jgi:hypothetical protein
MSAAGATPPVNSGARQAVSVGMSLLLGATLSFLSFGTIFSGLWIGLLAVCLCFAGFGALGVAKGRVAPLATAIALAAPNVPWVLWLTPAAVAESGWVGLLWPALALAQFGLAYLAGWLASRRRPAAPRH